MAATASLVVSAKDLDEAIEQYQALGFRLEAIGPADEPTWAEMTLGGTCLIIDTLRPVSDPPAIQVVSVVPVVSAEQSSNLDLPVGVELVSPSEPDLERSQAIQAWAVSHEAGGSWNVGRAGMRYRDLIPDRHGGAYIASHIHVPEGGPVPDYVHHHDVAFQMIFCHRGWVKVVYEDQGPPFVLDAGDGVLQPPGIRHQVLESSDDLFVVEITGPAVHRTSLDHDLELPTGRHQPDRPFGSQRFGRHVASTANWLPIIDGQSADGVRYEAAVTDIGLATNGVADVRVVRATEISSAPLPLDHHGDLRLIFVLRGACDMDRPDLERQSLLEGSSVAIPAGEPISLMRFAPRTELLDVVVR